MVKVMVMVMVMVKVMVKVMVELIKCLSHSNNYRVGVVVTK